MYMGQLIVRF